MFGQTFKTPVVSTRQYLLLFVLWLTVVPSFAQGEIQSHESITTAVYDFLSSQLSNDGTIDEISVGTLDARLRLKRCPVPLVTAFPPASRKQGNVTVGVKCEGEKPWSLYVQAKVSRLGEVVVAVRTMVRDEIVSADDVILQRRELDGVVGGYLTQLSDPLGMRVVRTIRADEVVNPAYLTQPILVKRGDRVTIMARSGGVEVRMDGKALSDGVMGAQIRVMNLSSKKEVKGIVLGQGSVEIGM